MAKIFATCLVTGQPIDTNFEIDEASFARLPAFAEKIFCPLVQQRARMVEGYGQGCAGRQAKTLNEPRP
jgi:hypothetical protein